MHMQDEITIVNAACVRVSLGAVTSYCLLVSAVFAYFDAQRMYLEPEERLVAGLAAGCLTTSLVLRTISQLCLALKPCGHYPQNAGAYRPKSGKASGMTWLSHTTNLVAAVTSWIFCFCKVPILWDPVTRCRVHLLRWCEWTVLSFVMTFMTETADRSSPWFSQRAVFLLSQLLSNNPRLSRESVCVTHTRTHEQFHFSSLSCSLSLSLSRLPLRSLALEEEEEEDEEEGEDEDFRRR